MTSLAQPTGNAATGKTPHGHALHRCSPNYPGHPVPIQARKTVVPDRTVQRTTPRPNPIAQVSYTPPVTPIFAATKRTATKLVEPQHLPASAVRSIGMGKGLSKASPELTKPWNMEEFRPPSATQYVRTQNPYRLVSDTQAVPSTRTVPPPMDLSRLTGSPTIPRRTVAAPTVTAGQTRRPILGLGRDLLNEFRPTNDRKWSQNHAVLQTATLEGNLATIHNIRYSKYEAGELTTTRYYDATFNLDDIRTIDLVIVPFRGAPRLAHVQSSFGFADGRHVGMSIEARYEEGEKYDALGSTMRQFELIYVLADERDLIREGAELNKSDVHVYRLKFEPSEVREMFVDALQRANQLAAKPEFYHPLRNSCVTNLMAHINKGRPNAIPKEYRTLLPGLMDNYAYDLKLIDTAATDFKEAKENSKVNWLAEKYGDLEYFSAGIRQNMY